MRINIEQLENMGWAVDVSKSYVDITPRSHDNGETARRISDAVDGHGLTDSQAEEVVRQALAAIDWAMLGNVIRDSL